MAEFNATHGPVTIIVTDDHRVAVTVNPPATPLTPGTASAVAESLTEASLVAVSNAKAEAAARSALAAASGPKHEDMW